MHNHTTDHYIPYQRLTHSMMLRLAARPAPEIAGCKMDIERLFCTCFDSIKCWRKINLGQSYLPELEHWFKYLIVVLVLSEADGAPFGKAISHLSQRIIPKHTLQFELQKSQLPCGCRELWGISLRVAYTSSGHVKKVFRWMRFKHILYRIIKWSVHFS